MTGRTATDSALEPLDAEARAPTLVVAFHPDPRFLGARRRLEPGETLVLGRGSPALGPECLDDGRISGRHCEVTHGAGGVHVRELGSRNGTRLDGHPVPGDAPVRWPEGGVLQLGRVLIVLEVAPLHWPASDLPGLVGQSVALADALVRIAHAAPLSSAVLVRGETGTGKELVARALHERSGRTGPFLAVSCAALDPNLLMSELFGHEKGAFSGADRARRGLVEEASAGTLFLDEIGEAPPALQAALLRVLQEREVRPVGGNRTVPVRTRFVAATHRDLERMVEAGTFRADLFARLAGWEVHLPALRERRCDVVPIALAVARQVAGRPVGLHPRLAHHLLLRDWPRNVRELQAFVEQVVVAAAGEDPVPLPAGISEVPDAAPAPEPAPIPRARTPHERPDPQRMRARIGELGGNLRAYAQELGIGRSTLYRWLQEAGLTPEDLRD